MTSSSLWKLKYHSSNEFVRDTMSNLVTVIPRDVLDLVMMKVDYFSLPALVKTSRVFRKLMKDPTFWVRKSYLDFSGTIKQREPRVCRLMYLHLYYDSLSRPYETVWDGPRSTEVIELSDRIRHEMRACFSDPVLGLPRLHMSMKLSVYLPKSDEGAMSYVYTDRDGHQKTYSFTVEIPDLVGYLICKIRPKTLKEMQHIFRTVAGREYPDPINPDDLMLCPHVNLFFYQEEELMIAYEHNNRLPYQVIGMLRRRHIHTQTDLGRLYHFFSYGHIIDNGSPLYIPFSESDYELKQPGYYHESLFAS